MSALFRRRWLLTQALFWLAVAIVLPICADEQKSPTDDELIEQIGAGKKQLEEKVDIDEAAKARAREHFDKALAEMEKAQAAAGRIVLFESRAAQAPEDLKQTRIALDSLPQLSSESSFEALGLQEIEQGISRLGADLDLRRKELALVDAELKGRAARKAELPKLISAAQQVSAETAGELEVPVPSDANPIVQAARRLFLVARQRAAQRLGGAAAHQDRLAHGQRLEAAEIVRQVPGQGVALADRALREAQACELGDVFGHVAHALQG